MCYGVMGKYIDVVNNYIKTTIVFCLLFLHFKSPKHSVHLTPVSAVSDLIEGK